jgi:hypothetical protein
MGTYYTSLLVTPAFDHAEVSLKHFSIGPIAVDRVTAYVPLTKLRVLLLARLNCALLCTHWRDAYAGRHRYPYTKSISCRLKQFM